jgi:pectate lyase
MHLFKDSLISCLTVTLLTCGGCSDDAGNFNPPTGQPSGNSGSGANSSAGNAAMSSGGSAATGGTTTAGSGAGGTPGAADAGAGNAGTPAAAGNGGAAQGGGAGAAQGGGAGAPQGGGAGAAQGGAAGAGGGGTVTPYVPAWTCLEPTWPSPSGDPVPISSSRTVEANQTYDGHMALHDGTGSGDFAKDCSASGTANQGTTKPLFILKNGATLQNVIMGKHAADGIHCEGTCTIKNVWFPYVCDDAVTALSGSSGTVTIDGGGAKNAHDKLFQDNSHGKFIISNFYGEKLGKMYRACGSGGACDDTKANLTITNVTAVGVDQIAGVTKGRDTATFSKVCTFQTPTICEIYDSNDDAITDGPDGTTCKYKWTDTQVMLKRGAGTFATASLCPNYLTSGSASNPATACIADLPSCINGCLPGDNGLKMCDCTGPGNTYKCHTCAGPSLEPAKSALAPAKAQAASACSGATENKACSPEWNICSSGTQYCACVYKPGYLQTANTVWDCVNPWW